MTDKKESTKCMGIIKLGWADELVMPMENAAAIMVLLQDAQRLKKKDDVPTLVPIAEYPSLKILPMTSYRQIKVNDLLDMG